MTDKLWPDAYMSTEDHHRAIAEKDAEIAALKARVAELENIKDGPVFPNPLQLHVGTGILVSHFRDADGGCGVLFEMTEETPVSGELYPQESLTLPHIPKPGEVYLKFSTAGSAVVVLEALSQVLIRLMGMPERQDYQREGEAAQA